MIPEDPTAARHLFETLALLETGLGLPPGSATVAMIEERPTGSWIVETATLRFIVTITRIELYSLHPEETWFVSTIDNFHLPEVAVTRAFGRLQREGLWP